MTEVNRTKKCSLCGGKNRQQFRVGKPEDPDWLLAICKFCDGWALELAIAKVVTEEKQGG